MRNFAMDNAPDISVFRPDRPGIRKVLGDLEADIMEVIWTRPIEQGTSVREVFEILYEDRSIAYTTVMSTMSRLAKKKLLRTKKKDQAYIYYPNFTQDEFILRFVSQVLENLLISFAGPTLDKLESLSDSETAAATRKLLERIAKQRAKEDNE